MISQEIFRYLLFPQLFTYTCISHSHVFPFYECSLHPSSTSISHGARLLESCVNVAYCRQDAAVERQESEPGRVKQACWHKKTLGHLPALGWLLNLRACFLTHADLCFLQSLNSTGPFSLWFMTAPVLQDQGMACRRWSQKEETGGKPSVLAWAVLSWMKSYMNSCIHNLPLLEAKETN